METIQEVLTDRVSDLIETLHHSGIDQVVLSPGSRSTPVAIWLGKLQDEGKIELYVDVDERSAAFFGLGIAKMSGKPVLLVCTSGTAAANYYPAIWEAKSSNIPLVVLTTDRPPELQEIGAPQTLDQTKMYSSAVKSFYQLPTPSANGSPADLSYTAYISQKAVSEAMRHPRGPVHINLPLRKPLMPNVDQIPTMQQQETWQTQLKPMLSEAAKKHLTQLFAGKKGIIIAGPVQDGGRNVQAIANFSQQMGWPLLADPLSGLRGYPNVVTTADQVFKVLLKLPSWLQPDIILRTGATLVSASMTNWLETKSAPVVYLDADRSWLDYTLSTTECIAASPDQILPQLTDIRGAPSGWSHSWSRLGAVIRETLRVERKREPLTEPTVAAVFSENLPQDSTLFVSNSMPIRDIDMQFDPRNIGIKVLCNRGANGIDGVNSTALGVATQNKSNYLYIGDLAFFHDLTGLMMVQPYQLNLTVVVQNNNGGGIFSTLPQYQERTQFEKVFGTPLNLNIAAIADLYNARYEKANNSFKLAKILAEKPQGLTIIEVQVMRGDVPNEQNRLQEKVAQKVQEFLNEN